MKKLSAVIVLVLLAASVAAADTVIETFTLTAGGLLRDGAGETLQTGTATSFAQFDPTLGTLTSVHEDLTGTVGYNGTTTVVHLVPNGSHLDWNTLIGATLSTGIGPTIDIGGNDLNAADLARFTGAGNLTPSLAITAPLNATGSFSLNLTGTITYNYTPAPPPAVPEPGTLGLLASGCVGIGYRLRRRIWSR